MDKTAFGVHNGAPDEIKLMHYDWLVAQDQTVLMGARFGSAAYRHKSTTQTSVFPRGHKPQPLPTLACIAWPFVISCG